MNFLRALFLICLLQIGLAENTPTQNAQSLQSIGSTEATPSLINISDLKPAPSKLLYINNTDDLERNFYVGQNIELNYQLLLLSDAKLFDIKILDNEQSSKLRLISITPWQPKLDSSNTYESKLTFKVLGKNAFLPQIEAIALTPEFKDIQITKKQKLNVLSLSDNPRYTGLIGDSFKIDSVTSRSYDNVSNIMILELEATNANLEDFKINQNNISNQGFQSIRTLSPTQIPQEDNANDIKDEELAQEAGNETPQIQPQIPQIQLPPNLSPMDTTGTKIGTYYLIFDKSQSQISFDYFTNNAYQNVNLNVVISDNSVSTQSDLKPKNIFLAYWGILLIALALIFLLISIFKRSIIFLILSLGAAGLLLWHLFYHENIELPKNTIVKILPTQNSTTLYTLKNAQKVRVIDNHDKYYKIELENGLIGWVQK
ncbi:MAG: SH3 domain-containing protein [Helicobacter sp.]|nr:SH3 domain-containing protein [Helicobacter sp.]